MLFDEFKLLPLVTGRIDRHVALVPITYLINRFDIIFSYTILGFKNPYYILLFGCYGNHRYVYLKANFYQK